MNEALDARSSRPPLFEFHIRENDDPNRFFHVDIIDQTYYPGESKPRNASMDSKRFWIINDDALKTQAIKDGSIDLVVTSPPYNVGIEYDSNEDELAYADYLHFSKEWFSRCLDWLKPDGRFCLNIPLDINKGGQRHVGADLTKLATEVGFQYHSTIVWNEGNISRRTAWGSWMRASAPYVIAPVELIVVLYKERWKKTSGSGESDMSKEEFMEWTNGLWTFPGESKKRIGHPAPFPVELPRRCVKLFSYVGDTILDPFMGSGTTLVAAVSNNRRGVGIEIDAGYCALAEARVSLWTAQLRLFEL